MADALLNENPAGIPDKLYFRIGEVSRLLGVEAYVLRYWETEFPKLTPKKSDTGRRLYRRKDVEQLLEIKCLLYEQGYTIAGARKYLGGRARTGGRKPSSEPKQADLFSSHSSAFEQIRTELRSILQVLK